MWCTSVRIVTAKKPADSLLCGGDINELCDGERLKVLRLRAGLTIKQTAEIVGICRHTLMNYEGGKAKIKAKVWDRIVGLYSGYYL